MTTEQQHLFWLRVRAYVASQAAHWSCGSEGRLLFENLCEHEDWQERLEELTPYHWLDSLESVSPKEVAATIVTNYFSQGF